mmetsp:Transcript_27633/g.49862  ORF Transcript_27633/g.49862 Transcript_27633/m.49862 type:complete len:143 (+) Transcript_27633:1248-1676(+)
MEDCKLVGELTSLQGRRKLPCAAYLSSMEFCFILKSKQIKISALCLIGAEIVPSCKTDFDLHSYNPDTFRFQLERFRCQSFDLASSWVLEIEKVAYPEDIRLNYAVLLNPISGGKTGSKLYYKHLLPKLKVSPSSHSLFGKG